MNPVEILEKQRAQNSARQKAYYARNAEKVKETRRTKYQAMVNVFKMANGIPIENAIPLPATIHEKVAQVHNQVDHAVETVAPATASPHEFKTLNDILTKLDEKQMKNYKTHYKAIFKILNTKDYMKIIDTNPKKVIHAIETATHGADEKPYSINSKKAYAQAILVSIDLGMPVPAETKKAYNEWFESMKVSSAIEQSEKEDNEIVMPFTEYRDIIEDHFGTESEEFLMVSLYKEMPVRDDFQLEIVKTIAEASDNDLQYIIIPTKEKERVTVIINKYKTSGKYGQIKEVLSVKLSNQIRSFIEFKNRTYGDFLFGKRKSNTDFISKTNAKVGIVGSVNLIRHMVATEFKLTAKERVALAGRMKHSPLMSLKYIRQLKE